MYQEQLKPLSHFFVAGINYKKSDAFIRGSFAVNTTQYHKAISHSAEFGIDDFFILSTCNRTEIYGFAEDAHQLVCLLTKVTEGDVDLFNTLSYVKSNNDAILHLFSVAGGLDSQILGDYEIVGQIKEAVKLAKQQSCLGPITERMVNDVLQSSKKIRTQTALSSGTVSVSFAAIQYIKSKLHCIDKHILLVGTGKFGTNICKNLVDYLPGNSITLVNRTIEKAAQLANTFQLQYASWNQMSILADDADVVLVATHASEPVLTADFFTSKKPRLIIDLSIPCNVAEEVKLINEITVIGVDELSKIKDDTLIMRSAEVPKAKSIILAHFNDFLNWYEMRRHVPVLKEVKRKLMVLKDDNIFDKQIILSVANVTGKSSEERIQKIINGMAKKMKNANNKGCHYIEAINDFISPSVN